MKPHLKKLNGRWYCTLDKRVGSGIEPIEAMQKCINTVIVERWQARGFQAKPGVLRSYFADTIRDEYGLPPMH